MIDREMQVGLGCRFYACCLPDRAQQIPRRDRVTDLDGNLLGKIGLVRRVAVRVPQDDRHTEALVLVDRVDASVRRRDDLLP